MRLVFAGTPQVAVPALAALAGSAHEVLAVITRPAAAAGRGRRLQPSPVQEWAATAGVPVLTPERPGDPALRAELAALSPECCPVVGYGALLPADLLGLPPQGWVNLHFSLLPAWRGAAPVPHALLAGDELTGATTFRITEALDAGPVFGVVTEPIGARDTAGELLARLAESGARLLVATLDGIAAGTLVPRPQPAEGVSWAPKLGPADLRVDWAAPAIRVDRLARAAAPHPGAWTTWRGERLGVGPVRPRPDLAPLAPAELRGTAGAVLVGTSTAPVQLTQVLPAGRRAMPAADWARGARLAAGDRLE